MQNHPQRVHVRGQRGPLTRPQFRGHVGWCSGRTARLHACSSTLGSSGETEIRDHCAHCSVGGSGQDHIVAFEITVHDQGAGFNPNEIPDPTKDENILKTSGRGIFFMRNFMDEVDWAADPKGGTQVRMIKKL